MILEIYNVGVTLKRINGNIFVQKGSSRQNILNKGNLSPDL